MEHKYDTKVTYNLANKLLSSEWSYTPPLHCKQPTTG